MELLPEQHGERVGITSKSHFSSKALAMKQISRVSITAFSFALCVLLSTATNAAAPDLPRTTVDTRMPEIMGSTIIVNSGDDLQRAIDLARPGDEIILEAGASFTGTFNLPDKGPSADWIIIRSSAEDALPPPGTRVSPADASNMPKIIGAGSPVIAFRAKANAHHYRIIGLEIFPRSGKFAYNLNTFAWSNHHIIFDRVYSHGNELGGRRFAAFHGKNMAVIDSHISDWWEFGADSQAVWWTEGQTHLLRNNFLEGAGEVVMIGGSDYKDERLASDITIIGNTFTKRLSWWSEDPSYDGRKRTIKNLLEFKVARRALIEGNTFTNFWIQHQYLPILFKSTNQSPMCRNPTAQVEHVTFVNNLLNGVASGIGIGNEGICANGELDSQHFLIENNLMLDMNMTGLWHASDQPANIRAFQVLGTHPNVTIRHNTVFNPEGDVRGAALWIEGNLENFVFENNVVGHSRYGVMGSNLSPGLSTLDSVAPGSVYRGNIQYGEQPGNIPRKYPEGNYFPPNIAAIGFVNYVEAGGCGNYSLADTSPFKNAGADGRNPGVDWSAFEAAQIRSRLRPTAEKPRKCDANTYLDSSSP